MRINKKKIFIFSIVSLLSAILFSITGMLVMMNYGGNNGCWPWADSLFGGAGYESCGSLGLVAGFILGGFFGTITVIIIAKWWEKFKQKH